MNSRVVSEANSKSMTDPNPTTPKRERPEDACSLSAVPMTVLGLALIVFAAFWLSSQPAQLSARIVQLALAVWAVHKIVSLIKGLIADLRGQEAMEKIATGGHWIATLLASAVFALLAVGVVSIVLSYTGPSILVFSDTKF